MNPRQTAMAKLRAYCPFRASEERSSMYLNHRNMAKVHTVDLVEAVERLGAMDRKGSSFPALGELLRICGEASGDRIRFAAERVDDDRGRGPYLKDLPDERRAELLAEWREVRQRLFKSHDAGCDSQPTRRSEPMSAETLAYIREQRALRKPGARGDQPG